MTDEFKILFVCTGNTCRSPMAEAIWRAMGGATAGSAGVSAWPGLEAAPHAVKAVSRFQASLDGHQARDIDEVKEFPDLVLTMTRAQRDGVIRERPEWADRTFLLTETVGESGDIADPIGQDLPAYEAVAEELHRLLKKLKSRLATGLQ